MGNNNHIKLYFSFVLIQLDDYVECFIKSNTLLFGMKIKEKILEYISCLQNPLSG